MRCLPYRGYCRPAGDGGRATQPSCTAHASRRPTWCWASWRDPVRRQGACWGAVLASASEWWSAHCICGQPWPTTTVDSGGDLNDQTDVPRDPGAAPSVLPMRGRAPPDADRTLSGSSGESRPERLFDASSPGIATPRVIAAAEDWTAAAICRTAQPTPQPRRFRSTPSVVGDISAKTEANPPGTVFWLGPGTHRLNKDEFAQVAPKAETPTWARQVRSWTVRAAIVTRSPARRVMSRCRT